MAYDITDDGVVVQHHRREVPDEVWMKLLDFMVARGESLRACLVLVDASGGPTSNQRQALADVVKSQGWTHRTAILTNSRISRATITALNWMTGRSDRTRVFVRDGLEAAFDFFGLDEEESARTRLLVEHLSEGKDTSKSVRAAL